ncbi:hypothetical protein AN958_07949 [Leucoagaricus sp. SymC.cos]|nr:hypothetical protein AN958_07949 [Leucoagaricus sp. SymC.cos]
MYRSTSPSPYAQPLRAYSPQPPPLNRAYSPQPPAQPYAPQPQPQLPPAAGQPVTEGSVTYTTSTGPDGRVLYHPFNDTVLLTDSYQTPNGIVSGIQWVPAEATHILPQGAQPASAEFSNSWNRGYAKDDKLKEWQREEDKRRKREEKESAKRLREQQEYRNEEKYERERRKSFNAGAPPAGFVPFPQGAASSVGRPASPYHQAYAEPTVSPYGATPGAGTNIYGRERKHSNVSGYDTLNRQFDDMDLNRERERKISFGYSSSARGGGDTAVKPATPYGTAPAAGQQQIYPRGHIMEGQPIPPRSRASSPMPGPPPGVSPYGQPYPEQSGRIQSHSPRPPPSPRLGGASPLIPGAVLPDPGQQLPPPEGFSRPVNPILSYTAFETTKIQAMEEFLLAPYPPRMPGVLKSHDVYPEDWQRLMNDLRLAWSGRLPVPSDNRGGQPPRRTTLVADLVDLWNTSFFLSRGVEVVLYKGRERRSGPKIGTIDHELRDDDNDSDRSESEEEEEDESDLEEYLMRNANAYGRPQDFDPVIIARRRREAKEEKRRARKEKEAKRKARAKEREKAYALYIIYVPVSGAVHTAGGMPGGYPPVPTTAYVPATGGYGRHQGY